MIKTTLPNRRAVAQIVREYRKLAGSRARPATLRAFAAALSQALRAQGRGVSYQSVKNWQDGRYLPDAYGMLCLARAAAWTGAASLPATCWRPCIPKATARPPRLAAKLSNSTVTPPS